MTKTVDFAEKGFDFASMTTPQLVEAFNTMLGTPEGQAVAEGGRYKEIAKFSTKQDGLTRCDKLASSIRAHREGMMAEAKRDDAPEAPKAKRGRKPKADAKPKAPKAPAEAMPGIPGEFDARAGTVRAKLLTALAGKLGKFVPISDLLTACYGSDNKEMRSALSMSLRGAELTIKNKPLKYEIRKDKENGVGLFKTA